MKPWLICECLSFGLLGIVISSREDLDFMRSIVSFEIVISSLGIGKLHQEIKQIVLAGIAGLPVFSVAGIIFIIFLVLHLIIFGVTFIPMNNIATVPLVESESAPKKK
jgi:hypothetical protein